MRDRLVRPRSGGLARSYGLYLVRWQLSTPILAACVYFLTEHIGAMWTTAVANTIGGLLFFWVDRWIFTRTDILHVGELWEVVEDAICIDCGRPVDRAYRLLKASGYDRANDKRPEFRCHECSRKKYASDKAAGRVGSNSQVDPRDVEECGKGVTPTTSGQALPDTAQAENSA